MSGNIGVVVERLRRITGHQEDHIVAMLEMLKSGDRLPGGLRGVPEEPTEAMRKAGVQAYWDTPLHYNEVVDVVDAVYRAMLAATTTDADDS